MTTYAYTSLTTNYIPKARVLAQTFKRHNPTAKFIVFMAEAIPPHLDELEPCFDEIIHISDLGIEPLQPWIFSHSVVEICTAIKGHALCSLLARPDCEQVFYIDPDIAVFDSFDDLVAQFAHGSVVLTPHQLAPETTPQAVVDNELCILTHGVFNLGFLAVRNDNNGRRFANWWRERLTTYCYTDYGNGLFTDQKWIDLAPALFPFIHIVRDPGYNVATWNLSTRTVTGGFEAGFEVRETAPEEVAAEGRRYPLRFYHFSGFDSGAQLNMLRRYGLEMPAVFALREWYITECARNGQETFGAVPWEYSVYQNGETITADQRRLYRQREDLQSAFADPFLTQNKGESYYHWYYTYGIRKGLGAAVESEAVGATAGEDDQRRAWRASVTRFLDDWWGGAAQARVLDYGGGVGIDAVYFAKACRSVYYCDPSAEATEIAVRRFAQSGARVTTVASTDEYSEHFAAVVAFDALDRSPDPAAQVEELVRLTQTGGVLFLAASRAADRDSTGQLDQLDALLEARGCRPAALLAERIRAYVKGPALTVAVPVYNAYDHVCRLMESIRSTAPGYPIRWLFVNDASPDARISGLLQSFAEEFEGSNQTCQVIDRTENRGFPLTANEAMEAAGTDDVILLNSDTIVYDAWARKLAQAAYSDARIGTVTPLGNNASIYSVFKTISANNNVNWALGDADLPVIDIPVGVGFCLYIKREALDRVGAFDPVFGKGYGEETDFCLRASEAGYRHVLAPTVFIYHAGSASMVSANVVQMGQQTIDAHERIVMSRYPHFSQAASAFTASGTTGRLQRDLANRYIALESSRRPSIAVVVHDDAFSNIVGGTTDHLRDMIRELGSEFVFYFITPSPIEDAVTVTAYVDGVRERIKPYEAEYEGLLAELNPSLIHVHHLLNYSSSFIDALTAWVGPKFYSVHDYFGVCKQLNLLNYKGEFCNIPGPDECGRCAHALWGVGYADIAARRAVFQKLIDTCALVIAPSSTALALFRKAISVPDAKAQVLPHPVVMQKYRDSLLDPVRRELLGPETVELKVADDDEYLETTPSHPAGETSTAFATSRVGVATAVAQRRHERDATLRVGVLGYNAPQKGTMLVNGIIAACANDPILFVSIGELAQGSAGLPNVISTGRYNRMEVVDLIESYKVDLIIVASIWPETFCFTVSESWMAGVPIMTGPIGAQAERVRATGAGVALDDLKVKTFVQALRSLVNDRARLDTMKLAAAHVVPVMDYDAYRERYLRATGGASSMTRLFSAVRREPPAGAQTLASVPLIEKLVGVRKRAFPVGSARERMYFWLHNRVTHAYSGNLLR